LGRRPTTAPSHHRGPRCKCKYCSVAYITLVLVRITITLSNQAKQHYTSTSPYYYHTIKPSKTAHHVLVCIAPRVFGSLACFRGLFCVHAHAAWRVMSAAAAEERADERRNRIVNLPATQADSNNTTQTCDLFGPLATEPIY
jgi:hypothetical protein